VGPVTRGRWLVLAVVGLVAAVVTAVLVLRPDGTAPVTTAPTPSAIATPTPAPTPSPEPVTAPLTGRPVKSGEPITRAAVAIKISDVPSAHPQVGVDQADIVFVEPIGVSYTRLAAVFHSTLPRTVGPVRSVRPMDAPLLSPMAPVFGHTMAAPWVLRYVESTGDLDSWGTLEAPSGAADPYRIDPRRRAPDHVLADPRKLLALGEGVSAPAPYFSYATDAARASAVVAGGRGRSVTIPYGPDWDVRWTYSSKGKRYLREQPWGRHVMTEGTQISATNVLVLAVGSQVTKIGSGGGAPVPVLDLVGGSGTFVALSRGASVRGTWRKGAVADPFVLRTDSGDPLLLAPGKTWVELPTPSADVRVR
jgi:hypothetical protein